MDDAFVQKLYEKNYQYHHLHWLQTSLSEHFLQDHGATPEEAKTAANLPRCGPFIDLETVWPTLSSKCQEALCEIVFVKNVPKPTVQCLTDAINKLAKFSRLSQVKRTEWLNRYFPAVKSSHKFEHNLHAFRLGERHAIWMIGLMDMTNWTNWIYLLTQLLRDS